MFLSCSTTKKQYSSQIYFTLDNYGVFQPIKLDESMLVYDKNTVSEYIAGADIVSKFDCVKQCAQFGWSWKLPTMLCNPFQFLPLLHK
jgi:hypothetical protein